MQLPDSSAVPFANNLRRMGGVPTQPRQNNPVAPAQRPAGQTPWGAPQQPHQGGRGGFGQPNPGAMAQKQFGGSPWSLANQNPKQAQMLGNGQSPFPGFEPQTGGPNFQFPRPDAIPPGPPGGSYGIHEVRMPYDQLGPGGQSYGPMEGLGAIPPGPPQGYGPFDPTAKHGQITGAIPPGLPQQMPADFGIPGMPNVSQRLWNQILPQNPGGSRLDAIPPGPAGQSYGPVEGGKPPVDRSWLRTEGLRRPNIDEAY